jgi:hypothetical protein
VRCGTEPPTRPWNVCRRATDAERIATGMIDRSLSPLYEGSGGPCLMCPYVAATTHASGYGQADVVFTDTTGPHSRWPASARYWFHSIPPWSGPFPT